MNNPPKLVKGFDITTLPKLNNVKTSDKSRTLLHIIAQMINEKYPDLLNFVDILSKVEPAQQVISGVDEAFKDLNSSYNRIQSILTALEAAQIPCKRLKSTVEKAGEVQKQMTEKYNALKEQMKFFGFTGGEATPPVFFETWTKFIEAFSICLNYNMSLLENPPEPKKKIEIVDEKWTKEREDFARRLNEDDFKVKKEKPKGSRINSLAKKGREPSNLKVSDTVQALRSDRNAFHNLRTSRKNLHSVMEK